MLCELDLTRSVAVPQERTEHADRCNVQELHYTGCQKVAGAECCDVELS